MLNVRREISARDFDQQIRTAGVAPGDVVREPPAQDQRCAGLHSVHGCRDRVGLVQLRLHRDSSGVKRDQFREHVALERNSRVQAYLILRRGNPSLGRY